MTAKEQLKLYYNEEEGEDFEWFISNLSGIASATGFSTEAAYEAAIEFFKVKLSVAKVIIATKAALSICRVTPTDKVVETTKTLVATMNAFKKE